MLTAINNKIIYCFNALRPCDRTALLFLQRVSIACYHHHPFITRKGAQSIKTVETERM